MRIKSVHSKLNLWDIPLAELPGEEKKRIQTYFFVETFRNRKKG